MHVFFIFLFFYLDMDLYPCTYYTTLFANTLFKARIGELAMSQWLFTWATLVKPPDFREESTLSRLVHQ